MNTLDQKSREYWQKLLAAEAFTAIPRWAVKPAVGVAEHEEAIADDLAEKLRRLADEMSVSLDSVLLAAHAKVLSALSGEKDVLTGYVAVAGGQPLPCQLSTKPESWRSLLVDAQRVEQELLRHKQFPVDELRRELGQTEPAFEAVFDPTDGHNALAKGAVFSVGSVRRDKQWTLRLRYGSDSIDKDYAARIAGYHIAARGLSPRIPMRSMGGKPCSPHTSLLFRLMDSPGRSASCRIAGFTNCLSSGAGQPRRGCRCAR